MIAASWRLRRVPPRGVTHLELWSRRVSGGLLWELVGAPRVEALRREGRAEPEIAGALARALLAALRALHEEKAFDALYLGGGLLDLEGMRDAVGAERAPFRVHASRDGAFAGERGGLALLREAGCPGGMVLDVGQTAIKASCRGRRSLRARDLEALPLRLIDPGGARPEISPERRASFADFVASFVAEIVTPGEPEFALLLALPCPLQDDLVPGACSYGWEGDRQLLPALFARVDALLPPGPAGCQREALLLNDAELVAASARAELAPPPGTRVLCVTLGFGPGGALLEA